MKWKKGIMTFLAGTLLLAGCGAKKEETAVTKEKETATTEAVSGASEHQSTPLEELKDSYDVIIVGAGGGGMSAAIEAKDKGLNPVIFEKMPVAGGNTVKASAGMNASNTHYQKEQGIEDNNDLFFEETLKGGKETNDQELLRYFVDHSAEAIDWLDGLGIELSNITTTGGMSVKRTHRPADGSAVGQYLVDGLQRNVYEREIPLFTNADVKEIIEKDGKVSGAKVTFNNKEEKEIKSKAVIVATGGFGANLEMVSEYNPDLKGFVTTNQEGSQGDGIKMIEKLGGQVVDLEQIQIHPTVEQETSYLITEAVRGEGAILVSDEGKRFVNELETRDNVSAAIIALPEKAAYLIFDASLRDRVKAIDFYDEQGLVKQGDTIEDLAKTLALKPDVLKETVETWNQAVKDGKDAEFDRTTGMEHELSQAPFYAIKIAPGIHHTMGGVKINTNAEVLDKDGHAIPGLYAAGEATGGLHGKNRIGGNAVADIIIYGRQSGNQASEYVKAN